MLTRAARSPQSWLFLLVLVDVLHRCVQLAAGPFPLTGDAPLYWRLGGALARGEGMLSVDPEVIRTPGYPLFLAVFQGLFGQHALQAAVFGQNVLAMVASLGVAWAAARLTGKPWAAPITYLVLLGCTGRVQYDQMILTESVSGTLLALHGVGFLLGVQEGRGRWWWLAGVTGAWLVLARPSMALLPVGEALLLVTFIRPAARRWLSLALVVGLPACGMATWMARNHAATGQWLLVGRAPTHAWEHTFQPWGPALPLPEHVEGTLPRGVDARNGWTVTGVLDGMGWGQARRDEWLVRAVEDARTAHPGLYWWGVAGSVFRLWAANQEAMPFYVRDGEAMRAALPDQATWRNPALVAPVRPALELATKFPVWMVASFSALCAAAAAFLWATGGPTRPVGIWVLGTMAYISSVTALKMYPLYRFHVPLHMVMALALGCALASAWERATRRRASAPRQ